jgi:hypothetical protein
VSQHRKLFGRGYRRLTARRDPAGFPRTETRDPVLPGQFVDPSSDLLLVGLGGVGADTRNDQDYTIRFHRLKAATSRAVNSNHSRCTLRSANLLCQYASIPLGSSVSIRCTTVPGSASWCPNSDSRRPIEFVYPIL